MTFTMYQSPLPRLPSKNQVKIRWTNVLPRLSRLSWVHWMEKPMATCCPSSMSLKQHLGICKMTTVVVTQKSPGTRITEVLKKFRMRGDHGDELACEPWKLLWRRTMWRLKVTYQPLTQEDATYLQLQHRHESCRFKNVRFKGSVAGSKEDI